jgi:hypothetical protein
VVPTAAIGRPTGCATLGTYPTNKVEVTSEKEQTSKKVLDVIQTGLDIVGLIPGFGEIADAANAAIYTARGDYANAALSAAACIPIVGSLGTTAKLVNKGSQVVETVVDGAKVIDNLVDTSKMVDKVNDAGKVIDNISDVSKGIDATKQTSNVASEVIEGGSQADVLAKNRTQGKAFEQQEFSDFSKTNSNAVEQVTIKTSSGTNTRVDAIGLDGNGNVVINEFKSSASAPLTPNQKIAFPEIYSSGGTVVGKGKGVFTGGYQIPSGTEVKIIRPEVK